MALIGSINSPNDFGLKNRIINGAMMIDQRNAGSSVTPSSNPTYTLDRWNLTFSQGSKFSIQQTPSATETGFATRVGAGFTNYLGATVVSSVSVGAGDYFAIQQLIEGLNVSDLAWGTANAKTITLSFLVRSSLTGTFGGAIGNSAGDRSYPFSYTISTANTWQQITVTIAGDTSGTWLTTNGIGMYVRFGLGVGSTYSGTAGAWAGALYISATSAVSVVGTGSATFYITGVQLEKGSAATSFDYRSYGTELSLCQRYYYQFSYGPSAGTSVHGYARSTTQAYFNVSNPSIMRISPAVAFTGTAPAFNDAAANYTLSGPSILASSENNNGFYAAITGATGFRPGTIFGGGGGAGATTFSAEL